MSDLENLQNRVVGAVEMLKRSQSERRRQNQSLGQVLNDLETKFEARTSELDHCRERIAQLESSNRGLTELVGKMIQVMERAAEETHEDPVFRATAAARDIVERYVGQPVANDETGEPDAAAGLPARIVPLLTPAEAFAKARGRFEDAGREFLYAEEMYERELGATTFPRLVRDAAATARGEMPEDDLPIDIPERARAEPVPEVSSDTDLDIKEIMARLEIAAERAQLRADADARRTAIEPAELERAVGGRG
ncbi:MAG: hypothetical protein WD470_08525 [Rhodospirillaceae bacterium]